MTISFKYSVLPDKFTNDTKKPIVKIILYGRNKTPITLIGLLDSGADISLLPKGLAEFLGLKLGEETTSKGISGDIKVKNSKVDMLLEGKRDEKHLIKNVPIQVAENDDCPPIIGRNGFFDRFVITIDEKNQRIKLKKNSKT